jgi:hypothetical protein
MDAVNTGGPATARRRSSESAKTAISWPAFRRPIPATSAGSDFRRTSESSRQTAVATMWRVRRRPAKEQLCSRDAPSAVGAEGTFAFGMSHGVENRKRGMFAIGGTRLVASRTASRSRVHLSTELSEHS